MKENVSVGTIATSSQKGQLKIARWGVLSFSATHLVFEYVIGSEEIILLPLLLNYIISIWYIKSKVKKKNVIEKPFLEGVFVSSVVFTIRLIIGIIFMYLIIY